MSQQPPGVFGSMKIFPAGQMQFTAYLLIRCTGCAQCLHSEIHWEIHLIHRFSHSLQNSKINIWLFWFQQVLPLKGSGTREAKYFLPGFMMLCGSSARLMRRCKSMCVAPARTQEVELHSLPTVWRTQTMRVTMVTTKHALLYIRLHRHMWVST